MSYIGKSPSGTGVRIRYYFTQTSGGATSISGTDDNNKTLSFSDGEYVDVYLNGVSLVAGTDYNTTTANTIGGLSALANGDVVEVVVYDIFTVADTVSQSSGGTFNGAVIMSNGLTVDDDGATVLTVDRATSNGNVAEFQKDGTTLAQIGAFGVRGYFAADNAGISPYGNVIYPTNGTGTAVDNTVDVGQASYRFKNLYLSGGAYIGGTGSANLFNDYEEGTWTPAYAAASGTITSHSNSSGFYTKVGRMVYIQGYVSYQADSSASGTITVTGLPFTSRSTGYGQSNNQAGGVASTVNALFNANSPDGGRIPNNATLIMPFVNAAGGGVQLDFSNFSTSANHSQFVFFGHYFI